MTRVVLPCLRAALAVLPACRSALSTKQSLPSGQVWLQRAPRPASLSTRSRCLHRARRVGCGCRCRSDLIASRSLPRVTSRPIAMTVQTGSPQSVQIALRPDPDAAIDSAPAVRSVRAPAARRALVRWAGPRSASG